MMINSYKGKIFNDFEQPTVLFDNGLHSVYWLGFPEETAFRTNAYLIKNQNELIVVDPGAYKNFEFIRKRIRQISPQKVSALVLCHQDPDVASSLPLWVRENPEIKIITSHRTQVLLPYYTTEDLNTFIINEDISFKFSSGDILKFVEAPFMHFPGAFATYDPISHFLFSGDVFAALDYDWTLVVKEFESHKSRLDLFHKDYMASNKATKNFAEKAEKLPISAILPQHGSIISQADVGEAFQYLKDLQCGLDLIYPE